VTNGGLISYAPDTIDPYRRAAGTSIRILREAGRHSGAGTD
jgi:hypothetical protein